MRAARYSLKPITVATLLTLSLSANAAVNYPTGDLSIDSTIGDQFEALQLNLNATCSGEGCTQYTGKESNLIQEIAVPGENDYDVAQSLVGFFDDSSWTKSNNQTLIVTSFDSVNGLVYAYSNHNGYINSDVMDSGSADGNRLFIDLNDEGHSKTVTYAGESPAQMGLVATIAAAAVSKGGGSDNQTIIRNASFNVASNDRPGMAVAALSVYMQTENVEHNTTYLKNVSIQMDSEKSDSEKNFVQIGSVMIFKGASATQANHNALWIENSSLEAGSIYGVQGYAADTVADHNVVYIEGSELWVNPKGTGNNTAGIFVVSNVSAITNNWLEVVDTNIISPESTEALTVGAALAGHKADGNTTILRDTNINAGSNVVIVGGMSNRAVDTISASGNHLFVGGTASDKRSSIKAVSSGAKTALYGGALYSKDGTEKYVDNNEILIQNADFNNAEIRGAYVWGDNAVSTAKQNRVTINNASFLTANIYGAAFGSTSQSGETSSNEVSISNASFNDMSLYGSSVPSGNADNNTIEVSEITVSNTALIIGGNVVSDALGTATAENNHVIIGENVRSADNNRIQMTALMGGAIAHQGYINNNRLTTASVLDTANLGGFQHYEFILNQSWVDSQEAFINVTGALPVEIQPSGDNQTTVAIASSDLQLQPGVYTLINSAAGFADSDGNLLTSAEDLSALKQDMTLQQAASLVRIKQNTISKDDYDLIIGEGDKKLQISIEDGAIDPTPNPPKPDTVNPATDALMESSLSVAASLFSADDLLVESALTSRNSARMDGPFAAARAGTWNYDTKTRLEADVYSALLGWNINMESLSFGPFIEIGHANYDTRTSVDGASQSGSGRHNYVGAGVYGNWQTPFYVRLTGYLKGGVLENHYGVNLLGQATDFDRSSGYWGAHVGAHFDLALTDNLRARPFVSYFYDGREKETYNQAAIGEAKGATFAYDALNLHRVQVGSLFEYAYSETARPYFGITYEHVIKGKAEGSARDHEGELTLNASDIEGGTGIITAGWSYLNTPKDFELNLGVNGYVGTRNGVSAQMSANWLF